MKIVLDASMALSWQLKRVDSDELELSRQAFQAVRQFGAVVPALWFSEVANTLLIAERRRVATQQDTTGFLQDLSYLQIKMDEALPVLTQRQTITLARAYGLTGYDAVYLELTMRTEATLATLTDS